MPDFAFVREAEVEIESPPQLVPLYRRNLMDKKVYPFGTAFPVRHANGIFLITAGHCAKSNEGETLHCTYNGCRLILDDSSCEILQNDELDVAAIFLNDGRIVQLLAAISALPVEDDDIVHDPQLLRIFGYPQSKNKDIAEAKFVPKGVSLSVLPGTNPRLSSDIASEHRIELAMDPKTFVDDEGGRSFYFQKIEGMSGGPLIKFADRGSGVGGRVCGVFVEWDKNTRIGTAVRYRSVMQWLRSEVS